MEKLENMFKQSFNNIKKLIRFKPMWLGGRDDYRRVVVDREHRLMLEIGDVCKFEDKHGARYICIGTPFGIICVRRAMMLGKSIVRYETTKELVKAFGDIVKSDVNFFQAPTGILGEHGFSYLMGDQIQQDLAVIADMMRQAGRAVGDGIHPPRVKETIEQPKKETPPKSKKSERERKPRKHDSISNSILNSTPMSYERGTLDTSVAPAAKKTPYITVTA